MSSQSTTTTTTTSNNITVYKPPQAPTYNGKSVFLAGSIEMGKAEDWQTKLTNALSTRLSSSASSQPQHLTILNPRRQSWDSSWVQDISNPEFRTQVEWELDAQDNADVIAMFFHPETIAPISLLELGLYAASGKMVVCCPEGYHRRGNVQIVCAKYGIKMVGSMEELIEEVMKKLKA
ncbi:hypothetical protein D9758_015551 [Tetrapyrgos nigripes]|uniref:Uncharacterized protein n=1 Tax=Tetrapyrgos nigripes TaxID=182062 RepID=A0A8H5FEL9_9AGAR|nr:hypothetical protein D9758_015551 [Tetrapyrgos nigripes]